MHFTFIACGLLLGSLLHAQEPSGGDRICGEHFRQAGLQGLSYREAMVITGERFAAYQDFIFSRMAENPPDFGDIRLMNKVAQEHSESFFSGIGYPPNGDYHPFGIGEAARLQWSAAGSTAIGPDVQILLDKLYNLLQAYNPVNHKRCIKQISELREAALELKEESDVFAAGVPLSVTLSACQYWPEKAGYWMEKFARTHLVLQEQQESSKPYRTAETVCLPSNWHLVAAAATGSVRGVLNHLPEETAALWYSAFLPACSASAGNLMNQVIHCAIEWWPY